MYIAILFFLIVMVQQRFHVQVIHANKDNHEQLSLLGMGGKIESSHSSIVNFEVLTLKNTYFVSAFFVVFLISSTYHNKVIFITKKRGRRVSFLFPLI